MAHTCKTCGWYGRLILAPVTDYAAWESVDEMPSFEIVSHPKDVSYVRQYAGGQDTRSWKGTTRAQKQWARHLERLK